MPLFQLLGRKEIKVAADENKEPPKTVAMRQRRLFRAPRADDEPMFDDEPTADRLHLAHLADERASKRRPAKKATPSASHRTTRQHHGEREEACEGCSEEEGSADGTSLNSSDDDVFEVHEVLEEDTLRADGPRFLIRWAGYDSSHDSWEPEEHVAPQLIMDFRKARHLASTHLGDDYMHERKRMLWCATCTAHYPADSFSAVQRRNTPCRRACLNHHYKTHVGTPSAPHTGGHDSTPARATTKRKASIDLEDEMSERPPASGSGAYLPRLPGSPFALSPFSSHHGPPPPPRKAARPVARSLSTRQAALEIERCRLFGFGAS